MISKVFLILSVSLMAIAARPAAAQERADDGTPNTEAPVDAGTAAPMDGAVEPATGDGVEAAAEAAAEAAVENAASDTASDTGQAEPADADSAADQGPITVLDQVVPVAEDGSDEAGPPAEEAPTDRERLIAEFDRYRELRDAGVLDEAANAAKRVVEMSIEQTGPRSLDTAKALSNLALVQHQLGNYEAAQQNFASAIDIIEENEDRLSAMLINPLKGLGAAQLQSGRPDLAAGTYRAAVHISHVNEGPHNIDQIEILEALAETNLRLGDVEQAKNNQDMIYALNLRHYDGRAMEMVPSLMRRAKWQRRTGYILDERATYRRIIRILENENGKDDLSLIEPLTNLGESYFYVDTSDSNSFQTATIASGEIYFKRALRIAEEHPDSDWRLVADTMLSLADYYNYRSDLGRARRAYRDVWDLLSVDEERLAVRREKLETLTPLNDDPIPRYVAGATRQDQQVADSGIREGRIVVGFDVSSRGRVSRLTLVEARPAELEDIQSFVIREMRTRIYRPRFVDGEPVDTTDQVFTHTFYYQQEEVDKLREAQESGDAEAT